MLIPVCYQNKAGEVRAYTDPAAHSLSNPCRSPLTYVIQVRASLRRTSTSSRQLPPTPGLEHVEEEEGREGPPAPSGKPSQRRAKGQGMPAGVEIMTPSAPPESTQQKQAELDALSVIVGADLGQLTPEGQQRKAAAAGRVPVPLSPDRSTPGSQHHSPHHQPMHPSRYTHIYIWDYI